MPPSHVLVWVRPAVRSKESDFREGSEAQGEGVSERASKPTVREAEGEDELIGRSVQP
jgi:hypothetical protein